MKLPFLCAAVVAIVLAPACCWGEITRTQNSATQFQGSFNLAVDTGAGTQLFAASTTNAVVFEHFEAGTATPDFRVFYQPTGPAFNLNKSTFKLYGGDSNVAGFNGNFQRLAGNNGTNDAASGSFVSGLDGRQVDWSYSNLSYDDATSTLSGNFSFSGGAAVPEPASMALFGVGSAICGALGLRRIRKRRSTPTEKSDAGV